MNIFNEVNTIIKEKSFQDEIADFLYEICKIDTSPHSDVCINRQNEDMVFALIEKELKRLNLKESNIVYAPIDPTISKHPAFTKPYLIKNSTADSYKQRHNLLYLLDGEHDSSNGNIAVNAHIDTVAPFFSPTWDGDYIFGRGTCDDKGNVATIIGALKVIDILNRKKMINIKNKLTVMFVIEEETGGNGSLSIVLDRSLKKRYDSVLVLECASNKIHPANRGAVWYKCELNTSTSDKENRLRLLEAMAFGVLAIEHEGRLLSKESSHPLFPSRPVQTCNGILGNFGEHPSTIAGNISMLLCAEDITNQYSLILKTIEKALVDYTAIYGDKTKVTDKATGKVKVERHFDILTTEKDILKINIYGSTGHMGSIKSNDDAILKWAYITKALLLLKYKPKKIFSFRLSDYNLCEYLALEGGQGFLPTHSIKEVQTRISTAFTQGIKQYCNLCALPIEKIKSQTTFDKLHNDAYSSDISSNTVQNACQAGIESGIFDAKTKLTGWEVSCDARLFAQEYPDMPVITSGAGNLLHAHSDNEHLYIPELIKSICFTTNFILLENGCHKHD